MMKGDDEMLDLIVFSTLLGPGEKPLSQGIALRAGGAEVYFDRSYKREDSGGKGGYYVGGSFEYGGTLKGLVGYKYRNGGLWVKQSPIFGLVYDKGIRISLEQDFTYNKVLKLEGSLRLKQAIEWYERLEFSFGILNFKTLDSKRKIDFVTKIGFRF